ncbi:MAG: hypothetical protein K2J95_11925 [Lachnospiraceae bacterium]|nr:hypothetical protein [Lachnospiraceae bacterium]
MNTVFFVIMLAGSMICVGGIKKVKLMSETFRLAETKRYDHCMPVK